MAHPTGYVKAAVYHFVIAALYIGAVWYHLTGGINHIKDKQ